MESPSHLHTGSNPSSVQDSPQTATQYEQERKRCAVISPAFRHSAHQPGPMKPLLRRFSQQGTLFSKTHHQKRRVLGGQCNFQIFRHHHSICTSLSWALRKIYPSLGVYISHEAPFQMSTSSSILRWIMDNRRAPIYRLSSIFSWSLSTKSVTGRQGCDHRITYTGAASL